MVEEVLVLTVDESEIEKGLDEFSKEEVDNSEGSADGMTRNVMLIAVVGLLTMHCKSRAYLWNVIANTESTCSAELAEASSSTKTSHVMK